MYYIDATTFTAATVVCTDPELLTPAPDGYYSINGLVRQQLDGVLQFPVACPDCKGYEKPVEGELLLDLYPGAVAAYSLRLLDTAYTGDAIRVRRASDSAEQDIGFDGDGLLDESALAAFCAGTDGYIVRWYDQSSNGNDAVQAATSRQPKVYDSVTGVVLENSKPAIMFDGTTGGQGLFGSDISATPGAFSAVAVRNRTKTAPADNSIFDSDSGSGRATFDILGRALRLTNIFTGAFGGTGQTLVDAYSSSAQTSAFTNGAAISISGTHVDQDLSGAFAIGNFFAAGGQTGYGGTIQEVVIYQSDEVANRAAIEANINGHYDIYWDGSQLSLLDSYPSAAVAYSLRALNSAYTGPLIRVRRASNNVEQDIFATYDGELDTSALATFCAGTNGFVVRWYDQSGNGNDAVQATTANQPKVYDSVTGVELENGKPALDFDSSDNFTTTDAINVTPLFFAAVAQAVGRRQMFTIGSYLKFEASIWRATASQLYNLYVGEVSFDGTALNDESQHLFTGSYVSGAISGYVDGTLDISGTSSYTGSDSVKIGARNTAQMKLQEVIVYPSDQSANRTGIEANIATFYGITI